MVLPTMKIVFIQNIYSPIFNNYCQSILSMVKHSHSLSVISGIVTSVPLVVVVFLIVRRGAVMVGRFLYL